MSLQALNNLSKKIHQVIISKEFVLRSESFESSEDATRLKKSISELQSILESIGSQKSHSSITDLKKQLFPYLFKTDKSCESIPEIQLSLDETRRTEFDLCIASSPAAASIANGFQENLKDKTVSCLECLDNSHTKTFDASKAEHIIAGSRVLIVILSKSVLSYATIRFVMRAAIIYGVRVVLLHDQASCAFPGVDEIPPFLQSTEIFHDKAITYHHQYLQACIDEINKKLAKKSTEEDVITRAFLSHKRSSAQGLAGRLYQGLKDGYKVFLDSEADFDLHDLEVIVKHTDLFVFVLSEGIFESFWCLQELRAAVAAGKRILFVRDTKFQVPHPLPAHVADLQSVFENNPQIDYIAEYYNQCIQKLRKELGPSDKAVNSFRQVNPEFFKLLPTIQQSHPSEKFDINVSLTTQFKIRELLHAFHKNFRVPISKIRSLSINAAKTQLNDQELRELSESGINVFHLDIAGNSDISDEGLKALSEGCALIRHLNLSGVINITDAGIASLTAECHSLHSLNLANCANITNNGLKSIADGCSDLQELDLSGNSKAQLKFDDSGLTLLLSSCKKLQNLNLTWTRVTDGGLQALANTPRLQTIQLSWLPVTDASLQILAQACPGLTSINLSHCSKITDQGLKDLAFKCRSIHSLYLKGATGIKDDGLRAVGENLQNLQRLELTDLSQVSDAGLKDLVSHAKNLVCLTLPIKATDDVIGAVGLHLSKLERLNIAGANKITDASLVALSKGTSVLKSLNLTECDRITNAGLKALSIGCKEIHTLIVNQCEELDDEGLVEFVENEPKLQILHAERLQITDKTLDALASCCPNLKELNLEGCEEITDAGLKAIAAQLRLQSINLQDCEKVTKEGRALFHL